MENVTSYKKPNIFTNYNFLGSSEKYKCVRIYKNTKTQQKMYKGEFTINGQTKCKMFWEEKDAAKWVDFQRIANRLEPINILKRK